MSENSQRLAKVIANAGLASRRDAEKMIEAGRVKVNGKKIETPAYNVTDKDAVMVDDVPLAKPPLRLWLYYKPQGLVTTTRDEKGRKTIFDALPKALKNVNTVGRLDLNSEGLLLLTNHGGLKRSLELPETGWRRKYRVRAYGKVDEAKLDRLRKGITVDGVVYRPMEVTHERDQGDNAWYVVSIREGKNREIRRVFEAIGLQVNRLIRVSYGPFQLGAMEKGEVSEMRAKALRTLLGGLMPEGVELPEAPLDLAEAEPAPAKPARKGVKSGSPRANKANAKSPRSTYVPNKRPSTKREQKPSRSAPRGRK